MFRVLTHASFLSSVFDMDINRYRNIWPFEHARVRLQKPKPDHHSEGYGDAHHSSGSSTLMGSKSDHGATAYPYMESHAAAKKANLDLHSHSNSRSPQNDSASTSTSTSTSSPNDISTSTSSLFSSSTSTSSFSRNELRKDMEKERGSGSDSGDSDDYVNASYVQPLGTSKKYIATQGPLPETFVDFWTYVFSSLSAFRSFFLLSALLVCSTVSLFGGGAVVVVYRW